LIKIIGPIVQGLKGALAAASARASGDELSLAERDIPIKYVAAISILMLFPIAFLLWQFLSATPLAGMSAGIVALTLIYVVIVGVIIAAVCGYMAGLIGASNSPVSGVGILAVVGAALMLLIFFGRGETPEQTNAMIAYSLFATAIVFSIATISNDNLQDLKTGQIVGATPWRQQVALVIGVLFGSLAIPPVLDLLNNAFGFTGAAGAGENALAAPQAMLISTLGKGVLGGDLDWNLLGLGALIGIAVIVIDEVLQRSGKKRLHPLGVGMGIYLPMALTFMIVVGTILGHFYDKWAAQQRYPEAAKRMGVLGATGLIVGESLFGVAYAGIVAGTGNDAPLAVISDGSEVAAMGAGVLVFVGLVWWVYQRTRKAAA
jgi:putative OPT family oligopeptide transporter